MAGQKRVGLYHATAALPVCALLPRGKWKLNGSDFLLPKRGLYCRKPQEMARDHIL